MRYHIVHDTDTDDLIDRVNNRLKAGWELHGSFAVDGLDIYQPMIKRELDDELKLMVEDKGELNVSPL